MSGSKKPHTSFKRKCILFVIYLALLIVINTLVFFFIRGAITPLIAKLIWFAPPVIAFIATVVHVRSGKKDRIDEIADRM